MIGYQKIIKNSLKLFTLFIFFSVLTFLVYSTRWFVCVFTKKILKYALFDRLSGLVKPLVKPSPCHDWCHTSYTHAQPDIDRDTIRWLPIILKSLLIFGRPFPSNGSIMDPLILFCRTSKKTCVNMAVLRWMILSLLCF